MQDANLSDSVSGQTRIESVVKNERASGVSMHVAYWSMGKRWANFCCFDEEPVTVSGDDFVKSIEGTPVTVKSASLLSSKGMSSSGDISRRPYVCLGTQIGKGSPIRSPYVGHSVMRVTSSSPVAANSPPSHHKLCDDKNNTGTAIVITPSKRRQQDAIPPAIAGNSYPVQGMEGTFLLTMRGPAHVFLGSDFEVHIEITNKSPRTVSNLSLRVGNDESAKEFIGLSQDVPYVLHETCTYFGEVLCPGHSLKHTLHVYPLATGPLKLNNLLLAEKRSGEPRGPGKSHKSDEETYEFLQFYSCVVRERREF